MKKQTDIILKTEDLCKYYGSGDNLVKAADHINLQIRQGEFISIVGKSGSDALSKIRRRKIGFIFQSYNLIPSLNVWENIVLPLGLDGRPLDEAFIHDIVKMLGLSDKIKNLPNTLSGGQQQRCAIARAIAAKPSLILADEPTGNLDTKTGDDVMALLKASAKKYGQTLVVITHNEEIAQMADRTVTLADGRILSSTESEVVSDEE